LDVIASGPTSPDPTTLDDALDVLERYDLTGSVPLSVKNVLEKGRDGLIPETPKPGAPIFERVRNIIIGSNRIAIRAAEKKAQELGLTVRSLSSSITGEARNAGAMLAGEALKIRNSGNLSRPVAILSGGETTVTVRGPGLGGRNLELALAFAMQIEGSEGITLLSAGTDGTDGPTDAAGAIVNGMTVGRARASGVDPADCLDRNDSYRFFERTGDLFMTGPTGTNVMDLQIVVIA
ncbi:MAG TPA: MOFRL family protein, partial [Dissulfurispiraceae bacterium]|nr:MOFRL family protein [Dissulfurispiraceae bacterium]